MIDIGKQVAYWRYGVAEDWAVAQELINQGRVRHGLFFAHLALEKLLKAHVCRHTQDLAPSLHNLVRLAELAALPFLPPSQDEAKGYLRCAEEVYQWLMNQL